MKSGYFERTNLEHQTYERHTIIQKSETRVIRLQKHRLYRKFQNETVKHQESIYHNFVVCIIIRSIITRRNIMNSSICELG